MDKLRTFINDKSTTEQFIFALECGTTIGYIRKRLSMHKNGLGGRFREKIARAIADKSGGVVPYAEIGPPETDAVPTSRSRKRAA
jgi:hypothetical protein